MNRFAAALLGVGALWIGSATAAEAKAFFRSPPTKVSIHSPASNENQRNRTTLSVQVPHDAGEALQDVVLVQISGTETWDWGRRNPQLYRGPYGLHQRGQEGLATASLSASGRQLTIRLDPPIEPGQEVNVIFRGITPEAQIYMWTTRFVPAGTNPLASVGPTLRQHVYRSDTFH